jgi:hypothetical protein
MPQTLATLQADVLTIVKRADLSADILLHLKNAILNLHTSDYFLRDLAELSFKFSSPQPIYSLEYKSLIPRMRSIKYIHSADSITGAVIRQLCSIEPETFLNAYGAQKDYTFYQAGSNIQIRVSDKHDSFILGHYLYPDTTLTTQSWICEEFPQVVIYETARTLFKSIGYDEQSSSMQQLAAEGMRKIQMTGITTIGE